MKPKMFIASSADHLDLAYAAQEGLEYEVEATVWTQGVFNISRTAMSSLLDVLDESDFGLFILAPSDVTEMRNQEKQTVRDNVIFELGLFIGRLGIDRCFLVTPRGHDDLHLPTDLLGITTAEFEPNRQDKNLNAALGPACNKIRKSIAKYGSIASAAPSSSVNDVQGVEPELTSDPNDCLSFIQSWMGSRVSEQNTRAIMYKDVDTQLKLEPGSARKYIEEAARRWNYRVARKGAETILFEEIPQNLRNRYGID